MLDWIRFADLRPPQGDFIVAITHRGIDLPVEVWEKDLERNAVGVWIDGEVWGGGLSSTDFTPDLVVGRQDLAQLWGEESLLGHSGSDSAPEEMGFGLQLA